MNNKRILIYIGSFILLLSLGVVIGARQHKAAKISSETETQDSANPFRPKIYPINQEIEIEDTDLDDFKLQARTQAETHSFCYWNTSYSVDTSLWQSTGANHLYVRFFDVDWDEQSTEARPIATLENWNQQALPQFFTPTVYITNKVMAKSDKAALERLSKRLKKRIDMVCAEFGKDYFRTYGPRRMWDSTDDSWLAQQKQFAKEYRKRYSEVLIDCDWTKATEDNFFYFIGCLKEDLNGRQCSVTLRLWQYKKQQAGVPPADRCLLMCYNMQAIDKPNVDNSIASLDELKKYIEKGRYPVPLDIALPIFGWTLLYRGAQFKGILNDVTARSLEQNPIEYTALGGNKYELRVDKVLGSVFARTGDVLRVEQLSTQELRDMAQYLAETVPLDDKARITFFSWNQASILYYGTNEIKNIYTTFKK